MQYLIVWMIIDHLLLREIDEVLSSGGDGALELVELVSPLNLQQHGETSQCSQLLTAKQKIKTRNVIEEERRKDPPLIIEN